MYYAETDTPAVARTSNLNEELGQVSFNLPIWIICFMMGAVIRCYSDISFIDIIMWILLCRSDTYFLTKLEPWHEMLWNFENAALLELFMGVLFFSYCNSVSIVAIDSSVTVICFNTNTVTLSVSLFGFALVIYITVMPESN